MEQKTKIKLDPIVIILFLIVITIVLSGILHLFGFEATYKTVNTVTGSYDQKLVAVESLFSLSGLKYIFTSTVSSFISFKPLSMLIILLIGIGIMDKSGFLKTFFTALTTKIHRRVITFALVLICILMSLIGELGFVIMIPLSALFFYYGHRNPLTGIITAFASLTIGNALSLFITSVDSSLISTTITSASLLDSTYTISSFAFIGIMTITIIVIAIVITAITEKITVYNVPKYEVDATKKEFKMTKREARGMFLALIFGLIYLLIFIYNIIPGAPFGGNLLDYSQTLYIDKLFSPNSFFSQGFVFIVTIYFIVLGLSYGIGAKSIKSVNDFCDNLAHSLDGIGKVIILIFVISVFINVFKKTNIGIVVTASLTNLISISGFKGLALVLLLFFVTAIATILLPDTVSKWTIMAGTVVPVLINAGVSPEMGQVVFRFGEAVTYGLTPLMAYFVIYLATMEKYNQSEKPITLKEAIKYQAPYSIICGVCLVAVLIVFYTVGLPLGINALPTV